MHHSIVSFAKSLWNDNPKYKGLQIMLIGFFIAIAGAGVSLFGGVLRDEAEADSLLDIAATVVLYLGWAVLIIGAITMFGGIVTHWIGMFKK